MKNFLFIILFGINTSPQASCLKNLKSLFFGKTTSQSEEVVEDFDKSRRNFLRNGAAAVAVAATPTGVMGVAKATIAENVNRTALLRKAAKLRKSSTIIDMGDYAGSLEKVSHRGDFSSVSKILQKRAQVLSERLSSGSDLFSKIPERVILEGKRPSLKTVMNSSRYQDRILRKLRLSKIKILTNMDHELIETRNELMEVLLMSQQLSLDAFFNNSPETMAILFELDSALLKAWRNTLLDLFDHYEKHFELYPKFKKTLEHYFEEVDDVLNLLHEI